MQSLDILLSNQIVDKNAGILFQRDQTAKSQKEILEIKLNRLNKPNNSLIYHNNRAKIKGLVKAKIHVESLSSKILQLKERLNKKILTEDEEWMDNAEK